MLALLSGVEIVRSDRCGVKCTSSVFVGRLATTHSKDTVGRDPTKRNREI